VADWQFYGPPRAALSLATPLLKRNRKISNFKIQGGQDPYLHPLFLTPMYTRCSVSIGLGKYNASAACNHNVLPNRFSILIEDGAILGCGS